MSHWEEAIDVEYFAEDNEIIFTLEGDDSGNRYITAPFDAVLKAVLSKHNLPYAQCYQCSLYNKVKSGIVGSLMRQSRLEKK